MDFGGFFGRVGFRDRSVDSRFVGLQWIGGADPGHVQPLQPHVQGQSGAGDAIGCAGLDSVDSKGGRGSRRFGYHADQRLASGRNQRSLGLDQRGGPGLF